jgi:hypothetical protein
MSKPKDNFLKTLLSKFKNPSVSLSPAKRRLERVYNEEEPNLIKLRQDVASAISVEMQLDQQLKNRLRKQFDKGEVDPEVTTLENKLVQHRKVKDKLKEQLAERELHLQDVYDNKQGLIASLISEPKNGFVMVILLTILTVLYNLLRT